MKSRGVGGDQDGRTEGCETPFSQKYIYMWNYSHRILTDHWQKISYNQRYKKDHHITG